VSQTKTLEGTLHIREVTEEQAEEIKHEVAEAVCRVTGGPGSSEWSLEPGYPDTSPLPPREAGKR
jgi:hypothetical protein